MPEISVIMGVYNETNENIINYAVDSILEQTYKDFEFVIYNDGSCKETVDILHKISKSDDRIVLIGSDNNSGLAFSLNACIEVARGNFIARMDCDDYSHPKRLEKQLNFLKCHPDIDWCGTNAFLFDENGIWGVRQMKSTPSLNDFYKYSPYIHPSVMYRKSVFVNEGGYCESENTLRCEDYEIFMRLHYRGLHGANIQENLISYRETKETYAKRTWSTRVDECRLRYRNYKEMNMMSIKACLAIIRPIVGGLVPRSVIKWKKHRDGKI